MQFTTTANVSSCLRKDDESQSQLEPSHCYSLLLDAAFSFLLPRAGCLAISSCFKSELNSYRILVELFKCVSKFANTKFSMKYIFLGAKFRSEEGWCCHLMAKISPEWRQNECTLCTSCSPLLQHRQRQQHHQHH